MKKALKTALRYIIMILIPIVAAVAFTLIYGFCIGGEYYIWIRFALWAVVAALCLTVYKKATKTNMGEVAVIIILTAVCIIGFSGVIYDRINESSATLQDTYETEIIAVKHRGRYSGFEPMQTIWYFNSPDGEERYIKFYRYDWGYGMLHEKITVEEYIGMFDKTFCVRKE
ncbi:MAG: hypothetical protein IJN78_05005 [Clostridia bacterium]|nr:hypothetical protein [Clostridia bacterium]